MFPLVHAAVILFMLEAIEQSRKQTLSKMHFRIKYWFFLHYYVRDCPG